MYSRSNRWKENIYKNVQSFINLYIDDVRINSKYLFDFRKGGILFDGNFELGSTPSQYVEFKIKKGLVNKPKKIKVEYGLLYSDYSYTVEEINNMMVSVLNNTNVVNLMPNFETIPIGTYNVDDYNDNDGKTTTIKALDNMIKFDTDDGYYDASELIKKKGYATLGEIAQDICDKKGVELGSTSFLHSNKKIYVYDNEVTAREYISYIAEQANCFAVIGRDGKLYFRQIGQDEETIPLKLFKTYKFGEEYKISRVAYENGIESFKFGNNTRNTLWLNQENLFIVDEEQVQDIYNNIKDLTINSFEGTVIIDPAIDIGDKITIDGKTIIYQGEMRLQGRFIADIKSTISIKAKEETTTRKVSQKVINRRVQSRIDEEEAKITLLTEQNTENEEKISQLEVNLDGIDAQVKNNKIETDEALQTTKTELETKINVSAEGVESKVSKTLESYSTTEQTNTKINSAKTEAINTAGTNTDNKLKNYSTTTQMNSAITQKANEITTSVSESYITKTDSATNINKAKTDAINSANTNTANKLKDYSKTTEMNSAITQKANEISSALTQNIATAKTEAINSANTSTDNKLKNYSTTTQMNNTITQKITESENSTTSKIATAKTEAINSANTNTTNKLKEYTKTTQMNNIIEQKITDSENSITLSVNNKIEEIQVGGRNLLKNSKQTISNSNYNIATFQLAEAPVNEEEYTFSLKGKLGTGKTAFHIYNSGGNVHLGALKYDSSKDIYTLKFNWTNKSGSTTVNNTHIYVYAFDRTVTATSSIKWVKLEKGNKATDWTPAPEDTDTAIATAKAEIKATTDSISTEVSKKVNNSEFGTKIQQNAEAIQIAWNAISEFIQFINAQLQIKDNNKKILMSLNKSGLDFYYNGSYVGTIGTAYSDNNTSSRGLMFNLGYNSKFMAWAHQIVENGDFNIQLGFWKDYGLKLGTNMHSNDYSYFIGGDDKIAIGKNGIWRETDNTGILIFKTNGVLDCYNNIDMQGYSITGANNLIRTNAIEELNMPTYASDRSRIDLDFVTRNDGTFRVSINTSDGRLKKNISSSEINALDTINQIQHRKFNWKKSNEFQELGYIAQELESVNKDFITKVEQTDEEGNIIDYLYQVSDKNIIPYITKSIQELYQKQQEQNEIIQKQQTIIDTLMEKLNIEKEIEIKPNKIKVMKEKVINYDDEIKFTINKKIEKKTIKNDKKGMPIIIKNDLKNKNEIIVKEEK